MEQHSEDYEHEHEYADGDRNPDEERPFRQWWAGVAHCRPIGSLLAAIPVRYSRKLPGPGAPSGRRSQPHGGDPTRGRNEPAARDRSNYIIRLDLGADGLPGHYEQMWTRTDDEQQHELCRIPFFTYGLSLGDVITLTTADGAYRVESKSEQRTIRIAVQDQTYTHERHEDLHGGLTQIGVLTGTLVWERADPVVSD